MSKHEAGASQTAAALLDEFSLEMTGKDVPALEEAITAIPAGTRINVTFLGNENLEMRVTAARAVKEAGFVPVPHISARRLRSQDELEEFLAALHEVGASDEIFVVGGDPSEPEGPYVDSLAVIETGLLPEYGVKQVSISGYPEGHPDISTDVLDRALREKSAALTEQSLTQVIITQFGFDTAPALAWIDQVRGYGIVAPIRIGVPGPAGIKRLLSYARRFGVASSAGIVQKYGFSIANLLGTAGPNRFIEDLSEQLTTDRGEILLHFYTFGGMHTTAEWIKEFRNEAVSVS